MKKVLSICVNYNDEKNTSRFVSEFLRQKGSEHLAIIVVDTSARESLHPALIELSKRDSRVTVLNPRKNLGYFGGAYWGLSKYLQANDLPDWVIVSNTDIYFSDNYFLSKLFRITTKDKESVFAPKIYSSHTGLNQNPYMIKKPAYKKVYIQKIVFSFYLLFSIYYFISKYLKKIKRSISKSNNDFLNSLSIYAPHGSFIIFNKHFFNCGGNIDYKQFLFGEEYFVAETANKLGHKIKYEPNLSVIHDEHSTTGFFPTVSKFECVRDSIKYCYQKYYKTQEEF